jgi:hypothetical protein
MAATTCWSDSHRHGYICPMIDAESLYLQLGHLVAKIPDLNGGDWDTPEGRRWLGRAGALVQASGKLADIATFNVACESLGGVLHSHNVQTIITIIHRTLANAEIAAPAALQGQFIAAGDTLTAFTAVAKVLARAKRDLLLVDVYADQTIITDFAVTAPEGVHVRILAADKEARKGALRPAAERWINQFGDGRPLSVRVAPTASLHDRLIIVDEKEAWAPGQSFNGMAQRSQTSVIRADTELAAQKVAAYGAAWDAAVPL